jgi:hypothetical protein
MSIERRWPEGVYVRELPTVEGKIYSQVIQSQRRRKALATHVTTSSPAATRDTNRGRKRC